MKISIVTTCFNSAATIRETIESILSQQGDFDLEYIITDAGSTDATLSIVREFGSRVRLIDARGTNQSQGINLGLRESTGEIVAFLNADDVYEPGALQMVVEAFRKEPEKLWLVGQCRIIDGEGKELHSPITTYKNFLLRRYAYWVLLIENFICQPSVFLRRQALEKFGYFSEAENLVMDYEYWLRIGPKYPPLVVNQYLARFRRIEGTKSNSAYGRQARDDVRVALGAARMHGPLWTLPFKFLSYLRTVTIYPFLYR